MEYRRSIVYDLSLTGSDATLMISAVTIGSTHVGECLIKNMICASRSLPLYCFKPFRTTPSPLFFLALPDSKICS